MIENWKQTCLKSAYRLKILIAATAGRNASSALSSLPHTQWRHSPFSVTHTAIGLCLDSTKTRLVKPNLTNSVISLGSLFFFSTKDKDKDPFNTFSHFFLCIFFYFSVTHTWVPLTHCQNPENPAKCLKIYLTFPF